MSGEFVWPDRWPRNAATVFFAVSAPALADSSRRRFCGDQIEARATAVRLRRPSFNPEPTATERARTRRRRWLRVKRRFSFAVGYDGGNVDRGQFDRDHAQPKFVAAVCRRCIMADRRIPTCALLALGMHRDRNRWRGRYAAVAAQN